MITAGLTVIQKAVLDELPTLGLSPGARVLDAPCGGSAALTLALIERGFHAIGADVDPEAGARLGNAFSKVDLNVALPWPDHSFEAIFSTEGIEHLENHFSFLREMCRVLKPGGILVLTTPNITALRSRVRFFGSGFSGATPGRSMNLRGIPFIISGSRHSRNCVTSCKCPASAWYKCGILTSSR